ncbi:caspase-3-like [Drosophila eugracilis]|uniref:caspase-3-like n=1 Tax=Drosophila eugracilis TaxID=29029 RepID=UPI0007E82E6B|nr:caspase-3-like [Drosophila eugracilis]
MDSKVQEPDKESGEEDGQKLQTTSMKFSWNGEIARDRNWIPDNRSKESELRPERMVFQVDALGGFPSSEAQTFGTVSKIKLQPPFVVILHHVDFQNDPKMQRKGSTKDVEALRNTFWKLECSITEVDNPTLAKVKETVAMLSSMDFALLAGLVIVILSHGDRKERIITCDHREYDLDSDVLFPLFENPSLAGKPKILIVQACKGSWKVDSVTTKRDPSSYIKWYSSTEGFVSHRHEKEGSIFIQAVSKVMDKYALVEDLKSIIERVDTEVKNKCLSEGLKQIPSYTSTLRERFCFGDFVSNAYASTSTSTSTTNQQ